MSSGLWLHAVAQAMATLLYLGLHLSVACSGWNLSQISNSVELLTFLGLSTKAIHIQDYVYKWS